VIYSTLLYLTNKYYLKNKLGLVYNIFIEGLKKTFQRNNNLENNIFLTTTNFLDGIKMSKHSKEGNEIYIFQAVINEAVILRTKDDNIIVLGLLEKTKGSFFSDELLIPIYSQMYDIAKNGIKVTIQGNERVLKVFPIQFTNDIPINKIFLGTEGHTSQFGCGKCTTKAISS